MDDLIRRQDVSGALTMECSWIIYDEYGQLTPNGREILRTLKKIPSAQKKGHWVFKREEHSTYISEQAVCSECGESCATYGLDKPRDRFCKWCGADMRGDEDG